ncbi:MAG TPA: MMPL family transporter [Thermoleophilaceae bacterium]
MDRLAGFLERRRWVVLAAWVALLVAALPFASHQTDHLTSGGFEVPGSQSQVVSENVHRFEGAQRDNLAVVLARRPGSDAAAVRAEVARVGQTAGRLPHVELTPNAAALAKRQAGSASITVVPLTVEGDRDDAADMAVDFRDELGTAARDGVLLPLKAVLMNLLSVAAAYGALVMVFQCGWFDGLLGYDSLGYVNAMTPPFLLAIVFGLSMDYEVFLLSRIRERYDATGDTRRAVAEGLRASAGTISSAALVRLILVPATMEIMGRLNWWLPMRVDRVLPHAGFESGSGRREPALDLGG